MRIKFLTPIAGERFSHRPGDVVDWPDAAEAQRYIAAGLAERAEPGPSSTATLRGPRERAGATPPLPPPAAAEGDAGDGFPTGAAGGPADPGDAQTGAAADPGDVEGDAAAGADAQGQPGELDATEDETGEVGDDTGETGPAAGHGKNRHKDKGGRKRR